MRNRKREKRFMALFLSALLLIQAPAVSAAELSGSSQLDELPARTWAGEGQDGSKIEGPAGDQEGIEDGLQMDAPAGDQRDVTGGDGTGDAKDFVIDEKGILTEYKGIGGEITIPAQVGGITVTGMKDKIFYENNSLTKVTILAEIEEISSEAFASCVNLKEVVFPKSLKHIKWRAFYACGQLEKAVFEEGLETIENIAFARCSSIKSIHIPLSVTKVSINAFESCTALESLTFQAGEAATERKICSGAFKGCTGLAEVELPAGMEMEGGAFGGCSGITEYKVQEGSAYEIFDKCLYEKGRTKLVAYPAGKGAEVTFPNEITAIGVRAFDGCVNIENVEIPDTVTEIGFYAFDGCSGLKKVALPKNIGSIKDGLFQDTGITSIEIPETVADIASFAFSGCQGLKTVTIPGKVERVNQLTFNGCSNLRSVYIQEGVKSIEVNAFMGCGSLEVLAIPKSVTRIEDEALPGAGENYGNLTIYGETGSEAEAYANKKGIQFSAGQPPEPEEEVYDISDKAFTVTLAQEVFDYDGKAKRPPVTVKKGETELMAGADFTVDYADNTNPGTAKAVVRGYNKYSGEVVKEFTIKGIDISGEGFTVTLSESEYTYDGKAKEPAVTVAKGTEKLSSTDFTVTYENNIEPGTAKAIVAGAGIYAGTVTKEFTIEPAPKDISDPGFTVTLSGDSYTYDGTEKKPAVTVKEGEKVLLQDTDFTVTYENNIRPGTAKAIAKGTGKYTGEVTVGFTIKGKDISGPGFTVTLSETVYTYDGTEKRPTVTIMEGTEKLPGTSFTVKYENNTNPGTAKAIVTGAGVYTGTVEKEFTINEAKKDTPSQEKKNIGLTCKKVFEKKYGDKAFSLQAKAVKGAKITYRSSDKKVADVDKKGKVTIKGTGIATITVKATASGYGAKTLKVAVKVSPSKASAPSLKTIKGRKLKVSWKKDKRATGYQVQYCTSKAFKKGVKTITISKNKTVNKTIPKLAKGKRYYVRVRAYKGVKVGKKTQKLYGAWSSVKRSGKIRK